MDTTIAHSTIENDADVAIVREPPHENFVEITVRPADDEDVACHDRVGARSSARCRAVALHLLDTPFNTTSTASLGN
jgi:hypothetical protein